MNIYRIHFIIPCIVMGRLVKNKETYNFWLKFFFLLKFLKMWNISCVCVTFLGRGPADLPCISPVLVCVLPKRAP